MWRSRWRWSSTTGEGARVDEIINSTRLANLRIQFTDLSSFLRLVSSVEWQTMKSFSLSVHESSYASRPVKFYVEINDCNLSRKENSLLLPSNTQ